MYMYMNRCVYRYDVHADMSVVMDASGIEIATTIIRSHPMSQDSTGRYHVSLPITITHSPPSPPQVYALGDGEVRSRLVSGLADVLSGKARQRVAKVDADSAVMPEGEVRGVREGVV